MRETFSYHYVFVLEPGIGITRTRIVLYKLENIKPDFHRACSFDRLIGLNKSLFKIPGCITTGDANVGQIELYIVSISILCGIFTRAVPLGGK